MDGDRIGRMTEVVHLEHVRTVILAVLRTSYPKQISAMELYEIIERSGPEIALNPLLAELHYLNEKQLVHLTSEKTTKVRITARGIDYLNGHIKEVGLAS